MAQEKLLTVRETASILGISEKEVMDLAEKGAIPAYKVGGVYLRFKKEQVQEFLKSNQPPSSRPQHLKESGFRDRVSDFFYFNDFFILAGLIILLLLIIILRG